MGLSRSRTRTVATVLVAGLTFVFGFALGRSGEAPDHDEALVLEARERIRELAVRLPDGGDLEREAIAGMLRALEDPYASYLPEPDGSSGSGETAAGGFSIPTSDPDEPQIDGELLDRHIGYVQLRSFFTGSGTLARAEIETLLGRGAEGIVLDLRGNVGGLVHEAVDVASVFVGAEPVLRYERPGFPVEVRQGTGSPLGGFALVVLVDGETASSAELVAAAVQDHGRGLVVGERTKGKATVQRIVTLTDGTAFRITTAVYLSPYGREIDGVGIPPDVRVSADGGRPIDRAVSILHATGAGS